MQNISLNNCCSELSLTWCCKNDTPHVCDIGRISSYCTNPRSIHYSLSQTHPSPNRARAQESLMTWASMREAVGIVIPKLHSHCSSDFCCTRNALRTYDRWIQSGCSNLLSLHAHKRVLLHNIEAVSAVTVGVMLMEESYVPRFIQLHTTLMAAVLSHNLV